jgi:hypothetical protein
VYCTREQKQTRSRAAARGVAAPRSSLAKIPAHRYPENMPTYKTTAADPHWREEELQWSRVLETGDAARGMTIIFMQKLCTAFHEFDPAYRRGALAERETEFFRDRLAERAQMTIRVMQSNDLQESDGYENLLRLLDSIQVAKSLAELADLTEIVHALGHQVCEGLEKRAVAAQA